MNVHVCVHYMYVCMSVCVPVHVYIRMYLCVCGDHIEHTILLG